MLSQIFVPLGGFPCIPTWQMWFLSLTREWHVWKGTGSLDITEPKGRPLQLLTEVALGKLLKVVEPQFSHLSDGLKY